MIASVLDKQSARIDQLDAALMEHFSGVLLVGDALNRTLVSFQANKSRPRYRWYKYKEAFSAELVESFLRDYAVIGSVLDPFAGSGTALFAASEMGLDADGIEILPVGRELVSARKVIEFALSQNDAETLTHWAHFQPWIHAKGASPIQELKITRGAYPAETKESIERYIASSREENENVVSVLMFALMCVLEQVSFTRKDGQYLRWDYRSGRRQGARSFDKGTIAEFNAAISGKLLEILNDSASTWGDAGKGRLSPSYGEIRLLNGSCLDLLPEISDSEYGAIITSPPYCNRYDYTRTYALELALLGTSEEDLVALRQTMLSCTVENRAKDLVLMNSRWDSVIRNASQHPLLNAILQYLDDSKQRGLLNNNGIPRMVKGYFYEMACVIDECFRVLKSGAPLVMVNDNVRYAGISISVDLILSSFAEQSGFRVEKILVLPNGKGNSSQQMGAHGRAPLRKCVYVWRKP